MGMYDRATQLFSVSIVVFGSVLQLGAAVPAHTSAEPRMPHIIEQFSADRMALNRAYPLSISPSHTARFEKFYTDELSALGAIDFSSLSQEDRVDYLLLKNRLGPQLRHTTDRARAVAQLSPRAGTGPARRRRRRG